MFRRLGVSLLLLTVVHAKPSQGPESKPKSAAPDYSQEAVVIEMFHARLKFENDGTSSTEYESRVRVQSEAGVQSYGLLNFQFASGTGDCDIDYVRVRKPDGSIVSTPPDTIQDTAAQVTREAPFYSDLREKHIPVKGLSVGDVLEYHIVEHTTKPLAPGQFWTSYGFTHTQIVLDEQLEVSVPRDRAIKVRSPDLTPTISDAGAYRVYTWHSQNLQHKDDTNNKREATEKTWQLARGRLPQPHILLSSFTTWEEVGKWYGNMQDQQVKPTPDVVAKANDLIKNLPDDDAKQRALYNYVSTQFRYIGIAFGIGRYQPHSAAAVLENQYGDCKDKHTLLASLLTAVGIPAYPALISTTHEVDADVPSPGQFDHVITVVPKPGGVVWLDTTAEVGPYQYLVSPLRDKHALVIWKDRPALVATPVDLPYQQTQTFNMAGKLSEAGTYEASADFSSRGDLEFLLRAGFRATPLPQWKDLGQRISAGLGFGGDVSELTASSPEKTDEAFRYSYKYTRKEFGDWTNHRTLAPEPIFGLPAPSDEDSLPLGPSWLGSLADIHFRSQIQLPSGFRPELPADIHVKHDFAEFDATYEFKDQKLIGDRHLKTLMREVPANERELFKKLVKTIQDDYGTYIPLLSGSESVTVRFERRKSDQGTFDSLQNLPDSANEEATRLESAARDATAKNDIPTAISSLYRAVAADPKFARAWVMLGTLLFAQKQTDAGTDAFHKAIAADPDQRAIPKALGYGLMAGDRVQDAVPIWQDYIKAHPDDLDGPANLGNCLFKLNRYSEAAAAYDAALKINPDRPNLQLSMASAYLLAGERDKAAASFRKMADLDKDGASFNDVAYQMANADLDLPIAFDFAQKAVHKAEDESDKIQLQQLKSEDLNNTQQLAAFWDTMGWVREHQSNLTEAEKYLRAAWKLSQDGVVGSHLCQVYQRTHQISAAIQMCRLAIYRMPLSAQLPLPQFESEMKTAKDTLKSLTDGSKAGDAAANGKPEPSDIIVRERRFNLPRFLPGTESADFFVLLESDGKSKTFKVADVKYISGSEKMKSEGKQLRSIEFDVPVPDDNPSRFVRRGILGCYQYSGCSFVLLDPSSVHSVN